MDKHYQLNITSDTTEINVSSIDSDEVARIVQLAGLTPSIPPVSAPPVPMADVMPASSPDSTEIQGYPETSMSDVEMPQPDPMDYAAESAMEEGQAEYDYGNPKENDKTREINVKDYQYKGPRNAQRYAHGADNALEIADELHEHLKSAYQRYLSESEKDNESGELSPLSTPTKPEFNTDPFEGKDPVDDGSHSPMSTVVRQPVPR